MLPCTWVSNLVWTKKKSYLLGLLAKIKCIICSYQLNIWYSALCTDDINAISHWGDGSPGQPGPFTHVALELHNIQEWHTLFFNKTKTNTQRQHIIHTIHTIHTQWLPVRVIKNRGRSEPLNVRGFKAFHEKTRPCPSSSLSLDRTLPTRKPVKGDAFLGNNTDTGGVLGGVI